MWLIYLILYIDFVGGFFAVVVCLFLRKCPSSKITQCKIGSVNGTKRGGRLQVCFPKRQGKTVNPSISGYHKFVNKPSLLPLRPTNPIPPSVSIGYVKAFFLFSQWKGLGKCLGGGQVSPAQLSLRPESFSLLLPPHWSVTPEEGSAQSNLHPGGAGTLRLRKGRKTEAL